MSSSDDEDETICPLCVEEMDLSDKNFLPCPCGYRVCIWCWHHIRENLNGLCPACRTPYNPDPHAFSAVDRQEIVKKNRERKLKERNDKKVSGPALPTGTATVAGKQLIQTVADRRHLHNYRVVQRNLIYVVNIPLGMANEELLRKAEYLGQYGKIGKVVVHRNHTATQTTVSAYVTFVYKEDAKAAIQSLEGYWMEGHLIRASFGTTKYCNNFIRGVPCNNPDCVYLHELGDDDDRFTKEEIQAGHSKLVPVPGRDQTIITGNGGPSGSGKKPTSEPVFPPPVFIQDINPTSKPVPMPAPKEKLSYWPSPGAGDASDEYTSSSDHGGDDTEDDSIITREIEATAAVIAATSNTTTTSAKTRTTTPAVPSASAIAASSSTTTTSSSSSSSSLSVTSTRHIPSVLVTAATPVSAAAVGTKGMDAPLPSTTVKVNNTASASVPAVVLSVDSTTNGTKVSNLTSTDNMNVSNTKVANSRIQYHIHAPVDTGSSGTSSSDSANSSSSSDDNSNIILENGQSGNGRSVRNGSVSSANNNTITEKATSQNNNGTHVTNGNNNNNNNNSKLVEPLPTLQQQSNSLSSFNGITRCAVFPVPVSSFTVSVWSAIINSSSTDLRMNPFGKLLLPISEFLDLTMPPVDAVCNAPWPRPLGYYKNGVDENGFSHTFVADNINKNKQDNNGINHNNINNIIIQSKT